MIVTQYGRLPGNNAGAAITGGPPRQSTAVDQLQRYYGTGDTASEPGDFKPGALWQFGWQNVEWRPVVLAALPVMSQGEQRLEARLSNVSTTINVTGLLRAAVVA